MGTDGLSSRCIVRAAARRIYIIVLIDDTGINWNTLILVETISQGAVVTDTIWSAALSSPVACLQSRLRSRNAKLILVVLVKKSSSTQSSVP